MVKLHNVAELINKSLLSRVSSFFFISTTKCLLTPHSILLFFPLLWFWCSFHCIVDWFILLNCWAVSLTKRQMASWKNQSSIWSSKWWELVFVASQVYRVPLWASGSSEIHWMQLSQENICMCILFHWCHLSFWKFQTIPVFLVFVFLFFLEKTKFSIQ